MSLRINQNHRYQEGNTAQDQTNFKCTFITPITKVAYPRLSICLSIIDPAKILVQGVQCDEWAGTD